MEALTVLAGATLMLPAFASRALPLARSRVGIVFYCANLCNEAVQKRLHLPRWLPELAAFAAGSLMLLTSGPGGLPWVLVAMAALFFAEVWVRRTERRMLVTVHAHQDRRWMPPGGEPDDSKCGAFPNPSPVPELTVRLEGPFVSRAPFYDLGGLALGREVELVVVAANHTVVPGSTPITCCVEACDWMDCELRDPAQAPAPLPSGGLCRWRVNLRVRDAGARGSVAIRLEWSDAAVKLEVRVRSAADGARVTAAEIVRYPGARRAAFAWRGDMDHYDTATFQSLQGLKTTLGLAARYRIPQTMYLSTRLTLDPEATSEYYDHYGVERGQAEIPEFVRWINENVELTTSSPYPTESDQTFVLELGNHMHLHYGTDAAASPGNAWSRCAGMGEGRYSWQEDDDESSFAEQRANALACRNAMECAFGFVPLTWAMPDSTRDEFTARAVEAAGCEVLSDSDARKLDNVLFQPPPHHPPGCGAVELTKRYPGDPESVYHAKMIEYWMHRSHRRGIPMIFMCHQHMRQFSGHACTRFTEHVVRHAVSGFNGDLLIDTVSALGRYWEAVLCPDHRCVEASVRDGHVEVRNSGGRTFADVPVDIRLSDGSLSTILVDLRPGDRIVLNSRGEEGER